MTEQQAFVAAQCYLS